MKGITASMTKPIQLKSKISCADNSGAKVLEVLNVITYKGRLRRLPKCGIGDVAVCSVKKGNEALRKKVVHAVIVRQRKEFRRPDGTRVAFSDNAAVLVNPKTFEPQGTEIRTAIAKEVVERFSPIGKIASIVL